MPLKHSALRAEEVMGEGRGDRTKEGGGGGEGRSEVGKVTCEVVVGLLRGVGQMEGCCGGGGEVRGRFSVVRKE